MTDVTTVKVRLTTRARLKSRGPSRTADDVINQALDALDREEGRRRMREQSHRVSQDPHDRREIESIMADMHYLAGDPGAG